MNHNQILDAIIRANKLGAKGIMVTGYLEPQSAASSGEFYLVTCQPPIMSTDATQWYDK